MFGHADMLWFSDSNGRPAAPPENVKVFTRNSTAPPIPMRAWSTKIENPRSGARRQQLVRARRLRQQLQRRIPPPFPVSPVSRRILQRLFRYDTAGVRKFAKYLSSLSRPIDPRSEKGHYYLLNNYNRLFRQRQECVLSIKIRPIRLHDSALLDPQHRRQPERSPYLVEAL